MLYKHDGQTWSRRESPKKMLQLSCLDPYYFAKSILIDGATVEVAKSPISLLHLITAPQSESP